MKAKTTFTNLIITLLLLISFSSFAQNDIAFNKLYVQYIAQINNNPVYDGFYSHRPNNQIIPIMFASDIINTGSFSQTSVTFFATVTDDLYNMVYHEFAFTSLLGIGDTIYLECPVYFTPSANNNYSLVMNCEQAETDVNPLDNISDSIYFSISDERSIKRYNEYNDHFSPSEYGGGIGSSVYVSFTVATNDTIKSLSVFIDSATTGGIITGHLLKASETDTLEIMQTEEYLIQAGDIGNWIELNYIPSNAGIDIIGPNLRYLASIEFYPQSEIFIGTDTTGYHDYIIETQYVIASGSNYTIQYLEEIPLIAINLSENTSGISDINTNKIIELYPNPANNLLNINITNGKSQVISIYNQTGQLVLQTEVNAQKQSIDISSLPVGSYFVRAIDSDNTWTAKFVVVR